MQNYRFVAQSRVAQRVQVMLKSFLELFCQIILQIRAEMPFMMVLGGFFSPLRFL